MEFTNCAVQAIKLEWKSQSPSEIFANSISQIPRALATANQRLRFLRRQLAKKTLWHCGMRLQKSTNDRQTDGIRNCGATNSEENEGYGPGKAMACDGAAETPSRSVPVHCSDTHRL